MDFVPLRHTNRRRWRLIRLDGNLLARSSFPPLRTRHNAIDRNRIGRRRRLNIWARSIAGRTKRRSIWSSFTISVLVKAESWGENGQGGVVRLRFHWSLHDRLQLWMVLSIIYVSQCIVVCSFLSFFSVLDAFHTSVFVSSPLNSQQQKLCHTYVPLLTMLFAATSSTPNAT